MTIRKCEIKNKTTLVTYFFSTLLIVTCSSVAIAHNFERISDAHKNNWTPERLEFMPIDRVVPQSKSSSNIEHPGLEFVLVLPNRWSQMQDLRVCFYGGSNELRKKILAIANDRWIRHTNLKISTESLSGITCRDKDDSEVRIGFNEPGYWSYIGNESINEKLVNKNLQSMNLEGFDTTPPPEPRFTAIVAHEWGHALGIHHEHQSPASGCEDEYNWPALYKYYKNNYGWNETKVNNNLKPLIANHSAYDWSPKVDKNSIMIYSSNPAFLKLGTNSKCYFHSNDNLSSIDIEGIKRAYPMQDADLALRFQERNIPIVLQKMQVEENLRNALQVQYDLTKKQLNLE